MADTINQFKEISKQYLEGKISNTEEFDRLLTLLLVDTLLGVRELLRDLKSIGEERNKQLNEEG
jgi:hypothetical protein